MEETLASQKMGEIDLFNSREKISSKIPNTNINLEGDIDKKQRQIRNSLKKFSSTTTHQTEIDLEKSFRI